MTKRRSLMDHRVASLIVELVLLELLASALLVLVEVGANFLGVIDLYVLPQLLVFDPT